jgi:hypothetical protein
MNAQPLVDDHAHVFTRDMPPWPIRAIGVITTSLTRNDVADAQARREVARLARVRRAYFPEASHEQMPHGKTAVEFGARFAPSAP